MHLETPPAPPANPALDYITAAEAARQLRLSVRTLQRYRAAGTGPVCKRVGSRRLVYSPADITRWIEAQQ